MRYAIKCKYFFITYNIIRNHTHIRFAHYIATSPNPYSNENPNQYPRPYLTLILTFSLT